MKKENVKIKDVITFADEVNAIESIVSSCFNEGKYTPYYVTIGQVIAIVENFIEGVEFEENELVYDLTIEDDELRSLVYRFFTDISDTEEAAIMNQENAYYINLFNRIMSNVNELVSFRKEQMIHYNSALNTIAEFCEVITDALDNFAKLDLREMKPGDIKLAMEFVKNMQDKNITETTLANAMKKVVTAHKVPNTKIYEGQRERIAEQQKQLQEMNKELTDLRKWKKEHEAYNVVSDKK